MFPEKKTKKLLPCGARKSKIFRMYPTISDDYLRGLMQSIQIDNNQHLPEEKARKLHSLNRKELGILVEIMGPPRGYIDKFED